jgi:hypothetical protein
MDRYQVDWVGAAGAGISAIVALLIARRIFKEPSGAVFYLVVAAMTVLSSLGLRTVLRYLGI